MKREDSTRTRRVEFSAWWGEILYQERDWIHLELYQVCCHLNSFFFLMSRAFTLQLDRLGCIESQLVRLLRVHSLLLRKLIITLMRWDVGQDGESERPSSFKIQVDYLLEHVYKLSKGMYTRLRKVCVYETVSRWSNQKYPPDKRLFMKENNNVQWWAQWVVQSYRFFDKI